MADALTICPSPPAEISRSRPKTCFHFLSHHSGRGFIIFSILLQLLQCINVNVQTTGGTRERGLDWSAAWPWGNCLFSLCLGSLPISSSYQDRDGLTNNYLHSVYILAGVCDKSCMKINNGLQFFILFTPLVIERHKLTLKLNTGKVVAQNHKMVFVIIIITIEDGTAELIFNFLWATDVRQKES